jgi:hypothetical protein
MLVRSHHYSFVIEQLENETESQFRAVSLLTRCLIDAAPDRIHQLSEVVREARRQVVYDEADCVAEA